MIEVLIGLAVIFGVLATVAGIVYLAAVVAKTKWNAGPLSFNEPPDFDDWFYFGAMGVMFIIMVAVIGGFLLALAFMIGDSIVGSSVEVAR